MYGERWDKGQNRTKVFDAVVALSGEQGRAVGLTAASLKAGFSRVTTLKHLKNLAERGYLDVQQVEWRPGIMAGRWTPSKAWRDGNRAQLRMRI